MFVLICILSGLALLLPAVAAAGPALMIDRAQVSIRGDATVQSARLEVVPQGVVVEMLARKDEWFNVRLPDGSAGWVHSALVQERLVVTGNGVRFREAGNSSAPALGVTSLNEVVGKIRQRGNWCEVELETGATGWISRNYLRPLEISLGPAAVAPAAAETQPELAVPQAQPVAAQPIVEVAPNHYADGLRHEAAGNYAAAVESFEKVLAGDPDKLSARRRAALAHKQLGNFDAAIEHLYHGIRQTGGRRDLYLNIGEIYRLKGVPDSASHYKALYRGEDPADVVNRGSSSDDAGEMVAAEGDGGRIIYAAGIGGAVVLGLLILLLLRQQRGRSDGKSKGEPAEVERGRGKFGRELAESSSRRGAGAVSSAEEQDLDSQIEQKWRELRETASAAAEDASGEDAWLEAIVDHLDVLRSGLEMQEQRAQVYTDIVRLQRMKIELMSEELRILRSRS